MLGTAYTFNEPPMNSAPSAVWHRGRLWMSFTGTGGSLVVRSSSVTTDPASGVRRDTGLACDISSIASSNNRLVVVYLDPNGRMMFTSSTLGTTFSTPIELPFAEGFIGASSLTAGPFGLALAWAENNGGVAHLAIGNVAGVFNDHTLPFSASSPVSLTLDHDGSHIFALVADRVGGPDSMFVTAVDPMQPEAAGPRLAVPDAGARRDLAICSSRYHGQHGLHVASRSTTEDAWAARSMDQALAATGQSESALLPVTDLSLTWDGDHAWVVMRSNTTELVVAPYASMFDLPENLRDLLGQPCDPKACPPDPRIVCSATDRQQWQWIPMQITNAMKGDLIVTPSDGAGPIGSLLNALDPPQWLDHNAIMIRDHDMVRHCTMAHKRLEGKSKDQPSRMMTGELFGEPAPTDGFASHALKYGWPGTITQSVEDAFQSGANTVDLGTGVPLNRQGDFYAHTNQPYPPLDQRDDKGRFFSDPEYPDDFYPISNIIPGPAFSMPLQQLLYTRVVKPPPVVEANNPGLRQVLHGIADAATTIDGHYRFFVYTDASIALSQNYFGPPSGDPYWAPLPPGADWCAGTRPLVCSSFVWLSVVKAIADGLVGPIVMEGSPEPGEPASAVHDGLYEYSEHSRAQAAAALHKFSAEKVQKTVQRAILELDDDSILPEITQYGLAALLGILANGAAFAATVFPALSVQSIADLILGFNDMPDDVATQMCNTFAFDRSEDTDGDGWEHPGPGVAVSPDDLAERWDTAQAAVDRVWRGLYGYSDEHANITQPRSEVVTVHEFAKSEGPAIAHGVVLYQGAPVDGARVWAGCEQTMTKTADRAPGTFDLDVPEGRYELVATAYWPGTNQTLRGTLDTILRAGDNADSLQIHLQDPPEWRRRVTVSGKVDLVRHVLVGNDDWAHTPVAKVYHLSYVPDGWGPAGDPPPDTRHTHQFDAFASDYAERFSVVLSVDVELKDPPDDLAVTVVVKAFLCESWFGSGEPPAGKYVDVAQTGGIYLQPGVSTPVVLDLNSENLPPDRGHIELTLINEAEPA